LGSPIYGRLTREMMMIIGFGDTLFFKQIQVREQNPGGQKSSCESRTGV
jgi:hypothetical protein